ncbi:MAG: hypothetical protein JXK05_10320 [Campylobacterales bacterium]|nr:hypothetical protein [Campylobacterales bacterium]
MSLDVFEQYKTHPQKIVDLKWLELELDRIVATPVAMHWNSAKQCVELEYQSEAEYQLLHRWSEHVGAALEVEKRSAYIYR